MRYLSCALIVFACADAAVAQHAAGDVYAIGGVTFPHQAELEPGSPPPFPAPAGNTIGWLAGGGVYLAPHVALEGDVSRTGTMHSSFSGRHDTTEIGTRRDWFLSLGVKTPFGPSVFRVEPIAGVVLVGDEGTYERTLGPPPGYRGYYPLAWVAGAMFGVDFRIGGRRVAVTPGLRFAFSGVPTGQDCAISNLSGQAECFEDAERWEFLHPRWTTRPSIALRVDF
jgi:hypothetical protein